MFKSIEIAFTPKEQDVIVCSSMKTLHLIHVPYLNRTEIEDALNTSLHPDLYFPHALTTLGAINIGMELKPSPEEPPKLYTLKLLLVVRAYYDSRCLDFEILGKRFNRAQIKILYDKYYPADSHTDEAVKQVKLNFKCLETVMPIITYIHNKYPNLGKSVTDHIKHEIGDTVKGVYLGQTGMFVDFSTRPPKEFITRLSLTHNPKFKLFLNGKSITGTKQILY